MQLPFSLQQKIYPSAIDQIGLQHDQLQGFADWLKKFPRPLVFTNGCFDILHRGHVTYLSQAAELGASLIVAVNDDASVKALGKGEDRPINNLQDRLVVLAGLQSIHGVIPFSAQTPLTTILEVRPEVLVKGGDWAIDKIVGVKEVQSWGGAVHSIPFQVDASTTSLIEKIRDY